MQPTVYHIDSTSDQLVVWLHYEAYELEKLAEGKVRRLQCQVLPDTPNRVIGGTILHVD